MPYSVGKSSYPDLKGVEQYVATGDVAAQVASLCFEFDTQVAKGGDRLTVNEGIRSRERQDYLYALFLSGRGALAANPYTSTHDHTRGSALDFGVTMPNGQNRALSQAEFDWLHAQAPKRGIRWTGAGFSRVEPWHHNGGYDATLPPITGVNLPGEPIGTQADKPSTPAKKGRKNKMYIVHSPKGHTLFTANGSYKFAPIVVGVGKNKQTFLGSDQIKLFQRLIDADQSDVLNAAPEFNDVQTDIIRAVLKKVK